MGAQPPLLILPGALGVADGGRAASLLEQDRMVVTFSYGQEREIDPLLDRALQFVAATGAPRFDVMGFSIGGWYAQCLAARDPARVRKVVLAHSFSLERGQAWRFLLAAKLWPLLPPALKRAGIVKRARAALVPLKRLDPARYRTTLSEVSQAITSPEVRACLLAQQLSTYDSLLRPSGSSAHQPVLIVESDDDCLIGAKAREQLVRKYPRAERVVLKGAGHASAITAPEALASAVDSFLRN